MVKHVVLWNLKEENKSEQTLLKMKQILNDLVGVVPGLISVQVGFGFKGADIILISEHEDKAALETYRTHPAHVEVGKFVRAVVGSRTDCDFEC